MALAQSCTNAKKWEIELATLKSNNIRLTSSLQESTANVDEWKRQPHTYKEENLRLKLAMDAMKPAGSSATGTAENEEMHREIIFLKNRIQVLEKDMMNADLELKASNKNLKEKSNDPIIKQLIEVNNELSKRLIEMTNLNQKEMEKLLLQRST